MSDTKSEPLRVLFCLGVAQSFFDLPRSEIGAVWEAFSKMVRDLGTLPGIKIVGTIDDDRLMVGPSPAFPWTAYILADVEQHQNVVDACNLLRTTPVGDYNLWRFMRIEARIGRPLAIPGIE